jgi:uncharacterized protein
MNKPEQPPKRMLEAQRRFADHLRDPQGKAAPEGIEVRRIAVYRRLFFNNLRNLFARNFPVIRKLYGDSDWDTIIRDFMIHHRPSTPLFTEIGQEFVDYLENTRDAGHDDPPWLAELAHWEYLETTVRLHAADIDAVEVASETDLLDHCPVLNPTLAIGQYQWPVHRIGPDFRPDTPESSPVLLATYRRRDDKVAFMKINALTAHLLSNLQSADHQPGRSVLESIAEDINQPAEQVIESGTQLLTTLHHRQIILGSREP